MTIEIRLDHENQLDELVGENCSVHLEQMDDNSWWLGITDKTGRVSVRLFTKKARIIGNYEDERKQEL